MSEREIEQDGSGMEFLDGMIEAVRADVPQEPRWQAARGRLMEQLETPRKKTLVMKILRKTRSTKVGWAASAATLAAVIVLAVGMVLATRGRSLAFADVLEQIRTFRPYSCTQTVQYEGKPALTKRILRLSLSRRREIWPNGQVLVFDLSRRPSRVLILRTNEKLAFEETRTGVGPTQDPDILAIVRAVQTGPVEDLGTREVDGRKAQGFRRPDKINDLTVWADPKSGLPIRVELSQPNLERIIVYSDFDFDADLDESLFSTTAPEGYAVERVEKDGTPPTEEDLIEGLRAAATLLDGEFPPVFEFQGLRKALREHFEEKEAVPRAEEVKTSGAKLERALRYVGILEVFKKARDLRYIGKGVQLGDAASPVLWWQPKESETYRVVYGDLSVKDVAPDDLPSPGRAPEDE